MATLTNTVARVSDTTTGMAPYAGPGRRKTKLREVRWSALLGAEGATCFEDLPQARGLQWKDGFRGRLSTGGRAAHVRVDPAGGVRVALPLSRRPEPVDALALNASFPSNLRVAGPAHRPHLLADVPTDRTGFSRSLSEVRQRIRRDPGARGIAKKPVRGAKEPFEHVFDQLRDADGLLDVVDRELGWELGSRVRGGRVSVQASPERSGLRIHRTLVKPSELRGAASDRGLGAVYDAALRLNERTRFVRLSTLDGAVVVEARLQRAFVELDRVAETARAVALVGTEIRTHLQLLTRMEGVACRYADVFDLSHGDTSK